MKVDGKTSGAQISSLNLNSSKAQESKKSTGSALEQLGARGGAEKNQEIRQGSAKVELSSKAQQMKSAQDIARSAPDVDMEKVKKFQSLIDSGKYRVDSQKLADKIVDDHLLHSVMTEEK